MSEVIAQLNQWFGIHHKVSLVDRHESNGVEGTNKQVLRHIKSIVFDERLVDEWSHPMVLKWVEFLINSSVNSETGTSPFIATFGSLDEKYFQFQSNDFSKKKSLHEFISKLDGNLKVVRDLSKKHMDELVTQRTSANPPEGSENQFQPGDFVLFQLNPDRPLASKLTPRYQGPYEVLTHYRNDVECKHLVQGTVKKFFVGNLKIFRGSREEAVKAAMLDFDQYEISDISAYRGDPFVRSTMEFEVKFADGSVIWKTYSVDLSATIQFEAYCRSKPELFPLIYSAKEAKSYIRELNSSPITEVQPGVRVFVDLRSYGSMWYEHLGLPDSTHLTYVVVYEYIKWYSDKHHKIVAVCPIFDEQFTLDHCFIKAYGHKTEFDPRLMILIDRKFVKQYPQVLPNSKTRSLK